MCYATQMSPRPLRRASGSGTCGLRKESALLGKADPLTLRRSCLVARLAVQGVLFGSEFAQAVCAKWCLVPLVPSMRLRDSGASPDH